MNLTIDTNIIISVYFSDITNDNKDNIRSKYYKLRDGADKIYVSRTSVIELYTFVSRKKYDSMSREFKKRVRLIRFSKSPEFKKVKREILIKMESLLNDEKIEFINYDRGYIKNLINSSLEPKDKTIIEDALSIKSRLVTEDGDFKSEDKNAIILKN